MMKVDLKKTLLCQKTVPSSQVRDNQRFTLEGKKLREKEISKLMALISSLRSSPTNDTAQYIFIDNFILSFLECIHVCIIFIIDEITCVEQQVQHRHQWQAEVGGRPSPDHHHHYSDGDEL